MTRGSSSTVFVHPNDTPIVHPLASFFSPYEFFWAEREEKMRKILSLSFGHSMTSTYDEVLPIFFDLYEWSLDPTRPMSTSRLSLSPSTFASFLRSSDASLPTQGIPQTTFRAPKEAEAPSSSTTWSLPPHNPLFPHAPPFRLICRLPRLFPGRFCAFLAFAGPFFLGHTNTTP